MRKFLAFSLIAVAALPESAAAQSSASFTRAFTAEAAGGILGSAAGAVLGLTISEVDECGVDDLECTIRGLGVAGIGSVIGATTGTMLAGKWADSRPSLPGAIVGSLLGAVAGVALVHGLTEEVNLHLDKPLTIAVYSITQGLVTALGSRAVASLR
jgi:hypothetical protein